MKIILTPHLLEFLISEGYRYFLSKTEIRNYSNQLFTISLIPVKEKPVLNRYTLIYKAYFNLNQRLWQLALGVYNAKVWVVLNHKDVSKLKETFLDIMKKGTLKSQEFSSVYLMKRIY